MTKKLVDGGHRQLPNSKIEEDRRCNLQSRLCHQKRGGHSQPQCMCAGQVPSIYSLKNRISISN